MPRVTSTSTLSQNDYYAAGEIRPGQWIGAGAERLGLKSEVTREQFHALCENQNPETGERLTQRQLKEGQRRVFYDFTCSAPKSVSVLAVTLDDERLVTAHEEATHLAFRELETFAATRVRKQGNQKDRITGNLAAAAFTHTSSRALDPQLHTHFTVFNATFDERERCWKALEARGMYDAIRLTKMNPSRWSPSPVIHSRFNAPMVRKMFSHWVQVPPALMWGRNGN